ncbi:uncharacterized protein LOC143153640 [Ptiloglossa arizonensis]|uniref:uncharacterized protein LOC143153640 n=1 Tax=Ptiloglossa arizonensis TaxID=3350558 RepID=UPI003FA05FE5
MGPEGVSRANNNGGFDFDKCCRYIDWIKPILGTSLENRIYSGLEELVCTQNSPNANRLSCVNGCLDAATEWIDYLDACCAKNIEARDAMIKKAIEYLVEDGLVTHFVDTGTLNNRTNRMVCQEPDSTITEKNIWKNMNVWRFINEKDYWLCQDCADVSPIGTSLEPSPGINSEIIERTINNRNSDLEVEVGSRTNETPAPSNSQRKHCDRYSLSDQTIANANSSKLPVYQRHSSPFNETEVHPRTNCSKKSRATMTCNCDLTKVPRKSSKLRVFVHKTTNTSRSTIPNPPKATSLSLPCKPSHLIVRIFEADPSLSDSCLVLMRRKFENSVRNVCSCLNDVLGKLEDAMIRELRLGCKIRSGRIDLNLRRQGSPKDRLFLARLPTCRNVHKRVTRLGTMDDHRSLQNSSENVRPPKDSEVYVDSCKDVTINETYDAKKEPCLSTSRNVHKCVTRLGTMDDHRSLQNSSENVRPPKHSEVYVDSFKDVTINETYDAKKEPCLPTSRNVHKRVTHFGTMADHHSSLQTSYQNVRPPKYSEVYVDVCDDVIRIKETDGGKKKPCLPTSRSIQNRVTRLGTVADRVSLRTPNENVRPPRDSEVFVNGCRNDALKTNNGTDVRKKCVTFYSPCSNNDSTEENEIRYQIQIEEYRDKKVTEKEMDFVWTGNTTKGVDQSSSCFARARGLEKSESSDIDSETESIRSSARVRNFERVLFLRENEEPCPVDTKMNDISEDRSFANPEKRTSSTSDSDCCSDSLQETPRDVVSQETESPLEVCSPEQCLCHVFCVDDDDTGKRETSDEPVARTEEVENFEGNRAERVHDCRSGETESKTKRTSSRTEEDVSRTGASFLRSGSSVGRLERNVPEIEKGTSSLLKTNNPEETNDTRRTRKEARVEENVSGTRNESERTEKLGANCIYDTKCSRCGKDLSDVEASDAELVNFIDTRPEGTGKDLEVSKISNSRTEVSKISNLRTEVPKISNSRTEVPKMSNSRTEETKECSSTRQPSKCKTSSVVDADVVASIRNRSHGRFPLTEFPRKSRKINGRSRLVDEDADRRAVSATRVNTKQFARRSNASTDRESFSEDLCTYMSRETHARPRLGKSRRSRRFATRPSSRSANNLRRIDTKTKEEVVPDRGAKEGNILATFTRHKRRFWKGSIVPGNLCASFPAASIDRIKHLIRKKLRRLLLEERDKGTSTSKTFLKNDRYLVSISSVKLNEVRTIRECRPEIAPSFRPVRNRTAIGEPEATFVVNNFEKGGKYTTDEVGNRRGRRILKKARVSNVSRISNQERASNDTRRSIDERHESTETDIRARTRTSCCDYGGYGRRSSVASLVSTRVLFLKDDPERCSGDVREKQTNGACSDKLLDQRARNSKREKFQTHFHGDFRFDRDSRRSGRNRCGCEFFARDQNRNRNLFRRVILDGVESRTSSQDSRPFDDRSFDYLENSDKDFSRVFGDYERCMNNLGADFRWKLLQYVALCRSVKDSLINRLRSDEVYEGSPRAPCSEARWTTRTDYSIPR